MTTPGPGEGDDEDHRAIKAEADWLRTRFYEEQRRADILTAERDALRAERDEVVMTARRADLALLVMDKNYSGALAEIDRRSAAAAEQRDTERMNRDELVKERDAAIARAEAAEKAAQHWERCSHLHNQDAHRELHEALALRSKLAAAEARERAMREAWIRARRVVRAARAVCSAWPNSPECDPLDDAIDILHDMVTAYDQAGHTDDATGAGGES